MSSTTTITPAQVAQEIIWHGKPPAGMDVQSILTDGVETSKGWKAALARCQVLERGIEMALCWMATRDWITSEQHPPLGLRKGIALRRSEDDPFLGGGDPDGQSRESVDAGLVMALQETVRDAAEQCVWDLMESGEAGRGLVEDYVMAKELRNNPALRTLGWKHRTAFAGDLRAAMDRRSASAQFLPADELEASFFDDAAIFWRGSRLVAAGAGANGGLMCSVLRLARSKVEDQQGADVADVADVAERGVALLSDLTGLTTRLVADGQLALWTAELQEGDDGRPAHLSYGERPSEQLSGGFTVAERYQAQLASDREDGTTHFGCSGDIPLSEYPGGPRISAVRMMYLRAVQVAHAAGALSPQPRALEVDEDGWAVEHGDEAVDAVFERSHRVALDLARTPATRERLAGQCPFPHGPLAQRAPIEVSPIEHPRTLAGLLRRGPAVARRRQSTLAPSSGRAATADQTAALDDADQVVATDLERIDVERGGAARRSSARRQGPAGGLGRGG